MVDLVIKNLVRSHAGVNAVDHLSLEVADGEFVSLLGPSGCGKSTTLAAIAGLDRPEEGEIRAGAKIFFSSSQGIYLPPEARGCGLVFQSYALWPHMTVFENVAFPLKLRKITGDEQKRRVGEALSLVEMEPFAARYPHQLSGGQQQRVALARTLSYRPAILLLDEPLSNLDAKLRDRARLWLAELRTKLKLTTIYVTHDQVEALSLSDRIVVMDHGKAAQIGTPEEIYERPATPFVADFIGTTNFLRGVVGGRASDSSWTLTLGDGQTVGIMASRALKSGDEVTLALRPSQLMLLDGDVHAEPHTVIRADVSSQSYVGARWQVALQVGDSQLRIESERRIESPQVRIVIPREDVTLFPGRAAMATA